jgi:hypothetical protein
LKDNYYIFVTKGLGTDTAVGKTKDSQVLLKTQASLMDSNPLICAIKTGRRLWQVFICTSLTSEAKTYHFDLQSKITAQKGSISRWKFPMLSFVVYQPFCLYPFNSLVIAYLHKVEFKVISMLPKPLLGQGSIRNAP